jgi:hypothetical protein
VIEIPKQGTAQELLALVNKARQDEFLEIEPSPDNDHCGGGLLVPIGDRALVMYRREGEEDLYVLVQAYKRAW